MRRTVLITMAVIVASLIGVLGVRIVLSSASPTQRALNALHGKDYDRALAELEKSPDTESLACRLALRLALLGADVQLVRHYESIWNNVTPIGEARQLLLGRRDKWLLALADSMEDLQRDAAELRVVYRRGQPLATPWRGVLRSSLHEDRLIAAMNSLKGGDAEDRYFSTFESGIMEIAVFTTLQAVLGQADEARVILAQEFNMPALLFHVGAKVTDLNLARWYMGEVVALTEEQPGHSLRKLAQGFLSE